MNPRNIYISVAVLTGILFLDALLLRNVGEAAMQAGEVLAFAAGFALLHFLDNRELRDNRGEDEASR